MKTRPKLILSTAIMGQLWPEQWGEMIEFAESVLRRESLDYRVGLEIVAAYKEPLLSIVLNRVRSLGLSERVETIHGRVDYDRVAIEGRMRAIKGVKRLELLAYDLLMAWVGEAYRAAVKFPNAKLLLHSTTMFQLEVTKVEKPRMLFSRLIVENDEKMDYPFGDEKLAGDMGRIGNALNPVDVLEFVEEKGAAKMVLDTAHMWRSCRKEGELEKVWEEFKRRVKKSKTPIYWHMNHDNSKHFLIRKKGKGFMSKHDEWLSRVAKFVGPRLKKGNDQICFEEPRKVRLRLSKRAMAEVQTGVEKSIVNLKEFGAL